jgi:cell wall-associated NlpC family hydrolase
MATRTQLIEAARKYTGIRWRHQGRSRMGMDCVGLLVLAGQDVGLPIKDFKAYARRSNGDDLIQAFYDNGCVRVAVNGMIPGDVLVLSDKIFPHHVALFTGTMPLGSIKVPSLIHARMEQNGKGVVREERMTDELMRDIHYVFRVPGLES